MRKYYLFIIKNDYYKTYKNNPQVLYKTLFNLYKIKKDNLNYGLSLYDNLCEVNRKTLLTNCIKKRFAHQMYNNKIIKLKLFKEKTVVQINYSCIIIITSINIPEIFKTLNMYTKRIFVCDFITHDYFWLNDQINKVR